MRVLVIGSGGREHALARALARDSQVTSLHAAPGNAGIGGLAELHPVAPADPAAITALAARLAADLVIVGPEAPLVAGAADALTAKGIPCFGPTAAAAMIEGSKSFAKDVMAAARIPTAAARRCENPVQAAAALDEFGPPYVVKDDGLAGGKGVLVTTDRQAALRHAGHCATVVIEEYLDGPELSLFAICDGTTAVPLLPAQDFKRAHDNDQGPNTGGMGAYTPLPWLPGSRTAEITDTVITPALTELARRGSPYRGLLYAGLALTVRGPRVVEFNARFGDPETQVILDRLQTPLAALLHAAATGSLAGAPPVRWLAGAAVTVVIAAEGYPANPSTGDTIEIPEPRTYSNYVLHAGTSRDKAGRLISTGGRVLNAVGTGPDLATARAAAYQAAATVHMRGAWYRRDIAARAAADPGGRNA
ncbi:MAG TPA: phosphoribosylamine--glycine ligase [Streptosporangiaceae bacterium]|nr:phosphoribosylamine--glycine ligase [Streptosporangiaceae bacterium]